jgi:hypothetical protein
MKRRLSRSTKQDRQRMHARSRRRSGQPSYFIGAPSACRKSPPRLGD